MRWRDRIAGATLAVVACLLAASAKGPGQTGADWPGYGGMNEAHYSPLKEITDKNVGRLGLAWFHDIEVGPSSYTAPIAVGGVLYFAGGHSVVHALDARTGKLLWRYDPEVWKVAGQKMRAAWGSRGIAYANGRVFTGTLDGRLIALDARTGKLLWSAMTIESDDKRYISGAPWVFKDKVVIGHGGADFAPVRGYVTAYDQASGKQAWRFYTVPGDPKKGFESPAMAAAAKTWTGEWWKFGGGGTVWNAMAYDPRFNRLYIGTGNGSPWNQKIRSPGGGDNLFICSIVALDADTGEYVWHYQVNPGETWDYNAAMDIELADLTIAGKVRPVILHAPKNGFFYVIDRETGKLISAERFAHVNWADRIDPATGRPVENPAARYPDGQAFLVFPSPTGAHAAEAMSFNPGTGLTYIPAVDQGRVYVDAPGPLSAWRHLDGQRLSNGTGPAPDSMVVPPITSSLLAWDPVAQKEAWRIPLTGPKNGATATTAGGLVMQGRMDGQFVIYAADSGKALWTFDAQTAVMAQPITYLAGGRQYISVIAGARVVASSGLPRDWDYNTQTWRVLTFALDGKAHLPPADATIRPVVDDPAFVVDPVRAASGKTIYAERCSICHGAGGASGGAAPDLRKSGVPLSDEAFASVLRDGVLAQRGMPRFEELTAADARALQDYIRQRARAQLAAAN